MNAKKIGFSGIKNPMSDNEMKLTRGGEPLGLGTDPNADYISDARDKCNLECNSASDCDKVCPKCDVISGWSGKKGCTNP